MEPNSHMIPGSQVLQHFPIPSGLNVIGSPIILPSDNASRYPVYPVTQVVASDSCPPCGQGGILTSQDHSMTQVSSYDPRRQRKHNIFTEEQKPVLQEQFNKCMYPDKKQCMTLAQRFGINEYHIKIWFKNRRARSNQKKTGKLPGNPGYDCHNRLTSPQCGIPLVTYASADTLYESSEQSKLQTSVTNVSLLRTTSLLHPPETVKQSSLQLHSAPERSQCPTVSLQPPLEPDPTVHAGHPILSTGSDPCNHQMPSTSAVGFSPEVSQASKFPSNAYGFQQICPEAPRRQRKERTVYTKEQKGILQEHFEHCKHPSLE
ncbi:homeobox protein unc-4 homolog [Mesocricetus auratus]|uniref:Homeobox protein unc-4 homolog n=1 Tax=Mesocricetus auratus TaxID=10036 RepID=A0ABM2WHB4_MESAU|nr:homeobox protein unc-4 homolog [Mesocricetus auratus]